MTKKIKIWCAVFLLGFSIFFSSAVYSADDNEKELFFVAQSAFDDGFYDVAIRYLDEFQQKYPQSDKKVQVLLLSGQCYFFKSQYLKAFNIFQGLLQHTEFKDATLFWMGETYLKGLDYAQAEKHYRQVIDLFPQSAYVPQALYSLGWALFDQKKYDDAQKSFKILIEKYPTHQLTEDASSKVAECAYNLGEYARAVELFKDYLVKFPQSSKISQVHFNIAESYYYQEKYAEANEYYKKVEGASQDTGMIVASLLSQGWGHLKLKDYDESSAAFGRAEQMAQEKGVLTDEIYLGKASFYAETGDQERALGAYAKLMELFPQSGRLLEAHLGRANVFYSMQKYPEAIEEYKAVISTGDPSGTHKDIIEKSNFGLAWTYLKMGKVDESIASFQNILDKTQSSAVKVSALTQIGDAYQDLNQWDKAVEVYDKILKDYPGSVYADYVQYRQGIALLKLGKMESATLTFQSLQQNFPNSKYLGDIDYYLGVAYFKKNDWATTIKYIDGFLKNPDHPADFMPEANYVLALSYLNSQKADEALKVFQKVIKLYPGDIPVVKNSEVGTARAYYQLGQEKEAVKRFKLIIYKYPGTETEFESLLWLAQYYFKTSDYAAAVDYYEQIVDRFPAVDKIGLVRYELGQAYELRGEFDRALKQYKLIASSDKEMIAKAGLAIAGIFSKELDPVKAAETYQTIIDNSPDFRRDAYLKLGQVYRKNAEYIKEVETYQKALASAKGSSDISDVQLQFSIGDAYEMMSSWDKATEAYLKVPYLYKDETAWAVKAYLRAARVFENNEQWDNAKTTYAKVLTYKTEEAKYAQERIDWISQLLSDKK